MGTVMPFLMLALHNIPGLQTQSLSFTCKGCQVEMLMDNRASTFTYVGYSPESQILKAS